jgi:hypothetical protein
VRPDRDDPLAPAIRRTLQGSRTDCPEAETIAAYADRSLASGERRDVERHLSHCARCRDTLLLMSRAEEKGTATSPLYRWPWLAAAAAAVLATVVWLRLPPSAVRSPESDRFAQIASEARQQPESLPEQSAAKNAPADRDVAGRKSLEKAPARPAPAAGAAATVPSADRQTFGERERPADQRRDERKLEESPRRRAKADAPASAPETAPPAAAAPPPAVAESVAVDTLMGRQNRDHVITAAPKRGAELASAVAPIAWRVLASGVVQRSADGGATWTAEAGVDAPGARAALAPTADVCWIVGDNGLILRFETGRGWTRMTPPARIAFVAIEASDARNATITAADGRRFTTADGGTTWK